jgi:glutamate formiminotransferase/formiminotetrahydrofolate cyclodeaminase
VDGVDKTNSMSKLIECVPNFSEGRDKGVIGVIAKSIESVDGVKLLSVEPDADYNRCVVTFVGEPYSVAEAAFQSTRAAAELIDMTKHKGEHPRLGATDVVPFIPISGVSMEDCVKIAGTYGERVARELKVPVYLYEEAARTPERRNLSNIRKGEYEGLEAKLRDAAWKPDFGEATFNQRSGATVTGARVFLIAYNVNLKSNNKEIAHEIALRIRESGRTVKDALGNSTKIPGTLKSVKAMGVLVERFNIAQVSINLTNFHVTPPHAAFEEVKKIATELGVDVKGSEVVGLIPKEALIMAGKFYLASDAEETSLIATAIDRLGLSTLEPFIPERKVIEMMI